MDKSLPGIVVTGASGFVGRNFLEAASDKYRLFCLARRSQREAGIPRNDNILWNQVDIGKLDTLREMVDIIEENGGADYVLHLAAFYNFNNADNPEYKRTNVKGTHNVLKLAQQIGTKRFLFASSIAACKFPQHGEALNEDSLADAKFPYARSKRAGEEMMKEYSEWFPCTTFRFAAVFSDWCEYPPLYYFLSAWLSQNWNARILGSRGESAVPYIHVHDLVKMFLKTIEKSNSLPRQSTYLASPNDSISHIDLFKTATRYFYGQEAEPIRIPKLLAIPGVALRQASRYLLGRVPQERVWMTKYIDRKLTVDASRTHQELNWEPTLRYSVLRRLLFVIERMKNHPDVWHLRNEQAVLRVMERPNLMIYDAMVEYREDLIDEITKQLLASEYRTRFRGYQKMEKSMLRWYIALVYQLVATTVRTRDRTLMRNYSQIIAHRRFVEGFEMREVCDALMTIGYIIGNELRSKVDLKDIEQRIFDNITMTFQLVVDEVEDSYEHMATQSPERLKQIKELSLPASDDDLERIVNELEDISQDALEDRLSAEYRRLKEKTQI